MLEIQDFTPKCDLCSIRRLVEYIHVARCFRFINSWKDLERKSVFCLCYVMLLIQIWQIINLIRARAGKDTLVYCCRAKLCSHFLGRTEGYLGYCCRLSARHSKMKFSYSKKVDFQRSVRHLIKGLSLSCVIAVFSFPS